MVYTAVGSVSAGLGEEGGARCDVRPIRQDEFDDLVWAHVAALLADRAPIAEPDRRLTEMRTANPPTAQRHRLELEANPDERGYGQAPGGLPGRPTVARRAGGWSHGSFIRADRERPPTSRSGWSAASSTSSFSEGRG
jgi:hypothetical protein